MFANINLKLLTFSFYWGKEQLTSIRSPFIFVEIEMMLRNQLYCLLCIIFISCNLTGKEGNSLEDSLDYYPPTPQGITKNEYRRYFNIVSHHFDSMLLNSGFSGQVLVAKNGVVIFEKALGFADYRTKDSMRSTTPLHLASASKTFTGMAILYLKEKGKLQLEDTLGTYFQNFPYPGITIKMLLSHRSGLPNYLNYLSELKQFDTCYSNSDVLNSLYNLKPRLEYRSGTRFNYSNTNFVLLALVIEKITGETYPVFLKKMFFDPLGMSKTFVYTSSDTLRATPSFEWNGRYWRLDQFDCTYGDKNIYSTASDLLKWDQALYSGQILSQATLDSAFTPLSNETRSVHNYGLAWRTIQYPNQKKIIYHNGRWHGSNVSFARLTDEKATIIVIGNKFNRNIYRSGSRAYNIFGNYLPGFVPADGEGNEMADSSDESNTDSAAKEDPKSAKTKQ